MHRNGVNRVAAALAICLAGAEARALDPGLPPGGNFDLSHWKLQLPTSNGVLTCDNGSVDEKTPAQLQAGFTNSYFYTGADGAMVFWAPINGATTSGSSYPRSELRERINPSSDGVNWLAWGTHILDGQCKVLQVPGSKKVIIGQIHGYSGAALPTVKLQYNNGSLEGFIKTNAVNTNLEKKFIFATGVPLGSNITYQIKVVNGLVSIVMNNVTNSLNIFVADPQWEVETMYFKAGDYCQSNGCSNPLNEGAKVAFYAVNVFHAPSITNQPASQTVPVGSNVTFTVGAAGNPPLRYFWHFNGAPLSGKTNAILTIPNIQLANAGNYSVVITDSVGTVNSVVTSSVATLTVLAPPAAPTGLTATALSETQVRLAWTDNAANETAYSVQRSPDSNTWSAITGSLPANSTNFTDLTCAPSTLYYYRVNCTNADGASSYAVASLTTPAGVGDGIAGWWRLQYFGDGLTTNGNSCATCDPDGDGQNNLAEYQAGTDPTSSASTLQILSILPQGNDIVVTWQTAAEKTNALQAGPDATNYTDIFIVTNTTGAMTNYSDIGATTNAPARFYRVRVVP
jgi:hypothetical protein